MVLPAKLGEGSQSLFQAKFSSFGQQLVWLTDELYICEDLLAARYLGRDIMHLDGCSTSARLDSRHAEKVLFLVQVSQ